MNDAVQKNWRMIQRFARDLNYKRRPGHCMGRRKRVRMTEMDIVRKHAHERVFGWRMVERRAWAATRRKRRALEQHRRQGR